MARRLCLCAAARVQLLKTCLTDIDTVAAIMRVLNHVTANSYPAESEFPCCPMLSCQCSVLRVLLHRHLLPLSCAVTCMT
jgi:hypothetical protein